MYIKQCLAKAEPSKGTNYTKLTHADNKENNKTLREWLSEQRKVGKVGIREK